MRAKIHNAACSAVLLDDAQIARRHDILVQFDIYLVVEVHGQAQRGVYQLVARSKPGVRTERCLVGTVDSRLTGGIVGGDVNHGSAERRHGVSVVYGGDAVGCSHIESCSFYLNIVFRMTCFGDGNGLVIGVEQRFII